MSSRNSLGSAQQEANDLWKELKANGTLLVCLVIILWAIELTDQLLGGMLDSFGIRPRQIGGLQGILFAPFLHGGWRHLISNTLPLVIMSAIILAIDFDEWITVTLFSALTSGLGTWIFGAPGTLHIGVSGVIFGYFGFLVTRAWFERTIGSLMGAVLILFLFGGMIWGILPVNVGISWEGHFFGLIGGVLVAKLISLIKRRA